MRQTRNSRAQQAAETPLPANEAALLERFRRLKDKQQSFVLQSLNLLLQNESVRPTSRKAEHAMLAVKWRVQGDSPFKTIEECKGVWENPNSLRFNVTDSGNGQTFGIADVDTPG